MLNNPVIYVFLNKSLHMTTGKAAAQAVHAAVMGCLISNENDHASWLKAIHKTVIVLEARDEAHLNNISKYLLQRGFHTQTVIDEGVNETEAHVVTALASQILEKEDQETIDAFSTFNLYKDIAKINVEFER